MTMNLHDIALRTAQTVGPARGLYTITVATCTDRHWAATIVVATSKPVEE